MLGRYVLHKLVRNTLLIESVTEAENGSQQSNSTACPSNVISSSNVSDTWMDCDGTVIIALLTLRILILTLRRRILQGKWSHTHWISNCNAYVLSISALIRGITVFHLMSLGILHSALHKASLLGYIQSNQTGQLHLESN